MEQDLRHFITGYYSDLCVRAEDTSSVNYWDLSDTVKHVMSQLHPETLKRYFGSGFTVPEHVEGKRILDIGCGSGILVFLLSKLVGPSGSVVGIDLTPNFIEECKKREEYHREKWGYDKKNTEFFVGEAEDLSQFQDQSFDVIVSNGVICMLTEKEKAFEEAFRLLKDGGEFCLNDVNASMKAPEEAMSDPFLWNNALTGSQTVDEFLTSTKNAGFTTPYLTGVGPIALAEENQAKLPGRRYLGAGNRLFRLDGANKRGAATVTYRGNIKGEESQFRWDVNLTFKTGQPVAVDGELATILTNSRYRDVFDIADTAESPSVQRAQNPFTYLDQLSSQGTSVPHIYTV